MIELPAIDPNSARLYCIIARASRRAVVFRRGPSKRVCLLAWNFENDVLERGQWFKGRVYERRCDLSPDGRLLAYFAASFREPHYSWTAVSRPPWLTALLFFPKGDCWGGGALFETNKTLNLNHAPGRSDEPETGKARAAKKVPKYLRAETERPWEKSGEEEIHPEQQQGGRLRIGDLGEYAGRGEDDPIQWLRLERDGWAWPQEHVEHAEHKSGSRFWITYDPPIIRRKPVGETGRHIQLSRHATKEKSGRWHVETLEIVEKDSVVFSAGRVDWADLDHNGDLLYSAQGKLFRMRIAGKGRTATHRDSVVVADLNDMAFEAKKPPPEALLWPR